MLFAMGQSGSSVGGRGGPRLSLRFSRRSKLNRSKLSHTFSVMVSDDLPELLNINTASEEQLMTLPGISRQIARNIVEYRRRIGRFRKVDDLALVSGIGAEKLDTMRAEICVSKRSISRASSCTQSLDSVRTNGEHMKVNVNTASVFQLQCIPGLNQELAGNIFYHRQKKGAFKSLDDLIKVRGIDSIRLGAIKPHLTLEPNKNNEIESLIKNGKLTNGISLDKKIENNNLIDAITACPRTPGHRKSSSMPIKHAMALANGFSSAPVNDIFDLLSAYSHRPIIEEDFAYERDGVRCCRIGTWNLDRLSLEKIHNAGVREVVCRTILENKISLLAIQEIENGLALHVLCEELNSPSLRRVRDWSSNSRRWRYCISSDTQGHKLGILYNACHKDITVESLSVDDLAEGERTKVQSLLDELEKVGQEIDSCQVFFQLMRVCGHKLGLLNVCAKGPLTDEEIGRLSSAGLSDTPVLLLGDLHSSDNLHLLEKSWTPSVKEGISTTLELMGSGRSDILRPSAGGVALNGVWGVVRVGLSHLAIPRGWSWGGAASPHCPVWAEYNAPD